MYYQCDNPEILSLYEQIHCTVDVFLFGGMALVFFAVVITGIVFVSKLVLGPERVSPLPHHGDLHLGRAHHLDSVGHMEKLAVKVPPTWRMRLHTTSTLSVTPAGLGPETVARQQIDSFLTEAGWVVPRRHGVPVHIQPAAPLDQSLHRAPPRRWGRDPEELPSARLCSACSNQRDNAGCRKLPRQTIGGLAGTKVVRRCPSRGRCYGSRFS